MMAAPTQSSIQNGIIQLWGLLKRLSTVVPPGKDSGTPSYPFLSYTPDPEWVEMTGSEAGALNHDLEIIFPLSDCLLTQDTTRLILFHESGPSLEAVADVLVKFSRPNNVLPKWIADLIASAEYTLEVTKMVSSIEL